MQQCCDWLPTPVQAFVSAVRPRSAPLRPAPTASGAPRPPSFVPDHSCWVLGTQGSPRAPPGLPWRLGTGPPMGLVEFAGWLATQVFDVVGSVAGAPAEPADGGSGDVDLQVGKTVFHDVPAKVSG